MSAMLNSISHMLPNIINIAFFVALIALAARLGKKLWRWAGKNE